MQPDHSLSQRAQLSMAPLVDVVLLLLIFFLLTSTHVVPQAIEVQLPESTTAARADDTLLTVVVLPSGEVSLDDETVAIVNLPAHVASRIEGERLRPIAVQADATTKLQLMLRVMDAVREGGGRNVSLATRSPGSPG